MENPPAPEGGRPESPGCPLTCGTHNPAEAHRGLGKAFIANPRGNAVGKKVGGGGEGGVTSCGAAW